MENRYHLFGDPNSDKVKEAQANLNIIGFNYTFIEKKEVLDPSLIDNEEENRIGLEEILAFCREQKRKKELENQGIH